MLQPHQDDAIVDEGPDAIDAVGMFDDVLVVEHLDRAQLVQRQQLATDDNRPLPLTDDAMERPTFFAMEHPMAYTTNLDGAAYLFTFLFSLNFPKTKIQFNECSFNTAL